MPTTQRPTHPSVIDNLSQHPDRFEFFQAIRLLQTALNSDQQKNPEALLGEQIRFTSSLSLTFPLAEIERLDKKSATTETPVTYSLCPSMIGLTGPMGALPVAYTQGISAQINHQREDATAAFLNLFNNRLISLFFLAATKQNLPLQYEIHGQRAYMDHLHALAGYTRASTSEPTIDEAFAQFSGLIQGQQVSGESLRQVLGAYLNEEVQVEQFIPEWFDIPKEQQTCLGTQFATLGQNTFCGQRVQQIDSRIRLKIGPVSRTTYNSLLPGGKAHQAIKQLIQRWCSSTISSEVVVILHKNEVKPVCLTSTEQSLGRGAFLISKSVTSHQDQTQYLLI